MRFLFYFFVSMVLSTSLVGQTTSPELLADKQPCIAPSMVAQAVISYEAGAKVYLEFTHLKSGQNLTLRSTDGVFSKRIKSFNSEVIEAGLPYDKAFELKALNACGEEVVVGTFTTQKQDIETDGISVSGRMFAAIEEFQRIGNMPLPEYLEGLMTVSPYEKIAFLQQFFFPNKKLATDEGTSLPKIGETDHAETNQKCTCALLVNLSQLAVPGEMFDVSFGNGNFSPSFEADSSEYGTWLPFDEDWKEKYSRRTTGPAKEHYLMNTGWNGNENHETEYFVENLGSGSPHMAQLRYNYACVNGTAIPRECACSKEIALEYYYGSVAQAYTHKGDGLADKNAVALTQDMAIVTVRNGDDVSVLDAGTLIVADTCSSDFQEEWLIDFVDLAGDVAMFFLSDSNSAEYGPLVDSLVSNITDLIGQPIILFGGECGYKTHPGTLVQGTKTVFMVPNKTVIATLSSYSHQYVSGKREWTSWSQINSDYYMTGFVKDGYLDMEERQCCTDKYMNWVYASLGGQLSMSQLRNLVTASVNQRGPWILGTAGVPITTMYGYKRLNIKDCGSEYPLGPLDPNNRNDLQALNGGTFDDGPIQVYVFDVNGKLILSEKSTFTPQELAGKVQAQGLTIAPGIYFVHIIEGSERKTMKVVVPE